MSISIPLTQSTIDQLDLTPVTGVIDQWQNPAAPDNDPLKFEIQYPQDETDPLELPEIPEVRLWFIHLDAQYPWMPYVLDWRSGELAQYAAMLVPHQFSDREGIQFNPQALDIFLMSKLFTLFHWTQHHGIQSTTKIQQMAEMFGYDIDGQLFDLLR